MRIGQLLSRCCFGRASRASSLTYEDVIEGKLARLELYEKRGYSTQSQFAHKQLVYEQFVYGHSVHIVGLTPNNMESQVWARSVMKHLNPRLLVLGGLSDNWLLLWERALGIRNKHEHPILRSDRMVCKDRIGKIIQERMIEDEDYVWHDRKQELLMINHRDRRIEPNDYLTVAHMGYGDDRTKFALGKPSDTLVYEDLMLRLSVDELKASLDRAVSSALQSDPQNAAWRPQSSLQALHDHVMREETSIHERELTYQAALLRQFAKIQDKILIFVPVQFVQRIADLVHSTEISPDLVFRDWMQDQSSPTYGLYQRAMQGDGQQLLRKFALISLLRGNCIEDEFANGRNVFGTTIFADKFKGVPLSEIMKRYMRAKDDVEGRWFELMQHRIKNVQNNRTGHKRLTLEDQLQLHTTRAKKEFPYEYQPRNFMSEHEERVKLAQLTEKMKELVREEDDPHQIELFDKFLQGYRSKEGIILYSKMLGKANVQSYDRIKLPVFHYAAFRGVYKEYLRDFLLHNEANSRMQAKLKKRMDKVQALMESDMKKIEDPEQLRRYVTGEKGRVMQINFSPDDSPQFREEDINHLKSVFGDMSPQDEQEMEEQFGEDWNEVPKQK